MKQSVALVSRRMTKARFAASKAADSHQASHPTGRDRGRRPQCLAAHAKGLRALQRQSAFVSCGGAVSQIWPPGCDCICLLCPNTQLLGLPTGECDLLDILRMSIELLLLYLN